MSKSVFKHDSWRSEKARFSVALSHEWITIVLSILAFILLAGGLGLIFIDLQIGYLITGFFMAPVMIVEWYKGELHHLKANKNPQTIDDVLSADILGRLSKNPSPLEVAQITGVCSGGYMFARRFGIGNRFLQDLASNDPADMEVVWREAWSLYEKTKSHNISAAIMVVAIINTSRSGKTLLNHLQLNCDDLIDGINWSNHVWALAKKSDEMKNTGGIARDWNFGWTPVIDHYGRDMSVRHSGRYFGLAIHQDILDKMNEIFSNDGRQNVALIGPEGVGKTEIVKAFAEQLLDARTSPKNTTYNRVVMLDASSLVASADSKSRLEELINKILNEAYSAKNVILFFDNAELFFDNSIGSIDIASTLMPIIESGSIKMIFAIDSQNYLKLAKNHTQLTNMFNRINVDPANKQQSLAVMQDTVLVYEYQHKVIYMYQALIEAINLSNRYIYDTALPGRALNLLESAANYHENGIVSANSVKIAIEKSIGVKIGMADEDEKQKLLGLEDLIHKRMVGQSSAVEAVSSALRRARAGVRNNNRPIGTFLFLGPTGVGKTELAKAVAATYFGEDSKIIRVDMNEYSSEEDVKRLIADGAKISTSLTAQVMRNPFSVILLDEIEKASDSVMSSLLQMLDEGILRDENDREINFKDAIIIATSNAVADRICEFIERGHDIAKMHDQIINELIDSRAFRPEFLNRFDEIVLFQPLDQKQLIQVVDLMIDDVNKTLETQKIVVKVDDDAKRYLVRTGYDPKLGARPMRRIIQKTVENIVAEEILKNDNMADAKIMVSLEQIKNIINKKQKADEIAGQNM